MGGGDKQTMQTSNSQQNSTNTSGPNPFIAPQLQNLVNSATGWMNNNQTAPGYFPGGTVAAMSPAEESARMTTWQNATRGLSGLDASFNPALGYLNDTIGGKYLNAADNPAYQASLEASFRPQAEHFRDILAPSIDSKFAGSGRTAGGAHFDTTMRGVQDLERSQSDAAAKAALGYYQGERGLQQGAASALPGMLGAKAGLANNWLAQMNQVGAGDRANNERILADQNAKYSYDTSGQLDWYNRLAQSLLGMYPGGQTTGQSSGSSSGMSQQSGGGGGVGSFLGPGLQIAGMALPFLSDRRDKTDIEELGVDPLTGLKTYAYRYKGEPKDQPKIVGPMAQDIEKARPDLVREIGGHKVVGLM